MNHTKGVQFSKAMHSLHFLFSTSSSTSNLFILKKAFMFRINSVLFFWINFFSWLATVVLNIIFRYLLLSWMFWTIVSLFMLCAHVCLSRSLVPSLHCTPLPHVSLNPIYTLMSPWCGWMSPVTVFYVLGFWIFFCI